MRPTRPRKLALSLIFTAALGAAPAAVSLASGQVVRCYYEVCIPNGHGGESCVEMPIDCPKPAL
jgi:hypothetical protein